MSSLVLKPLMKMTIHIETARITVLASCVCLSKMLGSHSPRRSLQPLCYRKLQFVSNRTGNRDLQHINAIGAKRDGLHCYYSGRANSTCVGFKRTRRAVPGFIRREICSAATWLENARNFVLRRSKHMGLEHLGLRPSYLDTCQVEPEDILQIQGNNPKKELNSQIQGLYRLKEQGLGHRALPLPATFSSKLQLNTLVRTFEQILDGVRNSRRNTPPPGVAGKVVHGTLTRHAREFRRRLHAEAWLGTHDMEGDWKYSPEWWGSQGGGWGHDDGEIVFESRSAMGNGIVSVTSHSASTPRPEYWPAVEKELHQRQIRAGQEYGRFRVVGYDWRVLRFNTVTRQSVGKVLVVGNVIDPSQNSLVQQPNCVAFEYLKSMLSVGLSTISLAGFNLEQVAQEAKEMRILCIGLGGGCLPLFLAHNLPGATVEVVEIDNKVIEAAIECMGFPPCQSPTHSKVASGIRGPTEEFSMDGFEARAQAVNGKEEMGREINGFQEVLWGSILRRMTVYEGDGEAYVLDMQQREAQMKKPHRKFYDLVFVDAYDGDDIIPTKFYNRNGPFLSSLNQLLDPEHGTVVVNLHTDAPPPSFLEKATGHYGPGFDPSLPQGTRVQEACLTYRDALLASPSSQKSPADGVAFTVAVPLQGNVSLVVSRGLPANHKQSSHSRQPKGVQTLADQLKIESKHVANFLRVPFDLPKRVVRGLQVVTERAKANKLH